MGPRTVVEVNEETVFEQPREHGVEQNRARHELFEHNGLRQASLGAEVLHIDDIRWRRVGIRTRDQ